MIMWHYLFGSSDNDSNEGGGNARHETMPRTGEAKPRKWADDADESTSLLNSDWVSLTPMRIQTQNLDSGEDYQTTSGTNGDYNYERDEHRSDGNKTLKKSFGGSEETLVLLKDDSEHDDRNDNKNSGWRSSQHLAVTAANGNDDKEEAAAALPTDVGKDDVPPKHRPLSAQEFYFPSHLPTIQRYYRFTSTTLTPICALHKRPPPSSSSSHHQQQHSPGVTGLLRRTAVVPSHGVDVFPHGHWILVSVLGRAGWARRQIVSESAAATLSMHSQPQQPVAAFVPAASFVAHEAWMGNHTFLRHGTIMLGSDAPSLLFTNALFAVGLTVHGACVLPNLPVATPVVQNLFGIWSSPAFMITATVLAALATLTALWATALTDPGIIPARSCPTKPRPPQNARVGGPLGYRYCSTCNIFRPPRSKHCNACNVCVECFDHHCPWTGSCIGRRNHFAFLMFLGCTTILLALVILACAEIMWARYVTLTLFAENGGPGPVLHRNYHITGLNPTLEHVANETAHTSHRLWQAMRGIPVTCLLCLFCILSLWSVAGLVAYHVVLVSVGQTTNERVRGVYRFGSQHNTNDRGCCANWQLYCTRPQTSSRLPRSFAEVVQGTMPDRPEAVWQGDVHMRVSHHDRTESGASLMGV